MFEKHFGLRENPFASGHQPRFVYPSHEHQEALAHLHYGIENLEPFVLITGEVGTGKTTALFEALAEMQSRVSVALITNSALTRAELLEEICLRFGVALDAPVSKPQAMAQLERHLLALRARGERAILLLDEAQNLERELLEEIRLLSNLEHDGEKLLQVFLVGQPELEAKLSRPELRQLRQRIGVHYRLRPLNLEDTERYIHHRIHVAGGYAPEVFPHDACVEVHTVTNGIPREINQICAQALLDAFVDESSRVRPEHVRSAARETAFQSVLPAAEVDPRLPPPAAWAAPAPAVPASSVRPPERAIETAAAHPAEPRPPSPAEPIPRPMVEPPTHEIAPPTREWGGEPVPAPGEPEAAPSPMAPPLPAEQPAAARTEAPPHPPEQPAPARTETPPLPAEQAAAARTEAAPLPSAEKSAPPEPDRASEAERWQAWLASLSQPAPEEPAAPSAPTTAPHEPPHAGTPVTPPPAPAQAEPPATPARPSEPATAAPRTRYAAESALEPARAPEPVGEASDWRPPTWTPESRENAGPRTRTLPPRLAEKMREAEAARPSGAGLKWLAGIAAVVVVVMVAIMLVRFSPLGKLVGRKPAVEAQPSVPQRAGAMAGVPAPAPIAEPGREQAGPTPITDSTAARSEPSGLVSAPEPPAVAPAAPVLRPPSATKPAQSARPRAAATTQPLVRRFGISVGTYLDRSRAEAELARVTGASGLSGRLAPVPQNGVTMYAVMIGEFATRGAAVRQASDLIARGLVDEARIVARTRAPAPAR